MDRFGGSFDPQDSEDQLDYEVAAEEPARETPPSPVGQDERRMQVRAYNHWASLLGDRAYPDIRDLDPASLEDFGPHSVLLDFSTGLENPAIQYIGARLAEECGAQDDSFATLADVPSRSLLSRITDHYMQILANQAPIGFEAEFVNQHGVTVLYRGILLPYSSDDRTIDFIYGVINWKEMADAKTADALLLEIDQALGDLDDAGSDEDAAGWPVETPEMLTERFAADNARALEEDDVFDLAHAHEVAEGDDDGAVLPAPAFGGAGTFDADGDEDDDYEDEDGDDQPVYSVGASLAARVGRGVDALGNPIGAGPQQDYGEADMYDGEGEDFGRFDSGMKTAADYGLPEWDDEPEAEDVDDLVDPLADEEITSSLMSLVSRGMRHKKSVDLSLTDAAPAIPEAYEGPGVAFQPYDPGVYETPHQPVDLSGESALPGADAGEDEDETILSIEPGSADTFDDEVTADDADHIASFGAPADLPAEPVASVSAPVAAKPETPAPAFAEDFEIAPDIEDAPVEGLYDCLAAAREQAQTALTTEDRSRKALYAAVALAYDFSLEAAAAPEDYAEIIADNGLTMQDRAPMTPIVKLVFGAEYDKTRLTEYAAVLMHAHRVGIGRGSLAGWLRTAEGGVKGIVAAERRARKEEQGKLVEDGKSVRQALAKKLRGLAPVAFEALAADGPEFALVMVRRSESGELVILGELPEDVPFLEKAAKKLIG